MERIMVTTDDFGKLSDNITIEQKFEEFYGDSYKEEFAKSLEYVINILNSDDFFIYKEFSIKSNFY